MSSFNEATEAGTQFLNKLLVETYTEPTQEKILNFYTSNGEEYEKYIVQAEWDAPYETVKTVGELHTTNRENLRILDVAAGTGLVSVELKKLGFKLIDGLEPANGMLAEAMKRGLYNRYFCDPLGNNKLDIENDTYDLITLCAGIAGMMAGECLAGIREIIRVVKPGGYIIVTSGDVHISIGDEPETDFERTIKPLEEEKLWKLINKRPIHFVAKFRGAVSVYRKL